MNVRLMSLAVLTACQHRAAHSEPPSPEPPPVVTRADLLAQIPETAEAAVRSVVSISATRKVSAAPPMLSDPMLQRFFGVPEAPRSRPEQGVGSGVIVRADGVVLTNAHVVDGAERLEVTLGTGETLSAEVIGVDSPSDVAVLQLTDPPDDLVPIPMGSSDGLRLGEVVLAIGNPFGIGQTVTMGIISATGRANVGIGDYEDFIQTDAAINPGNSGGALVNIRGELIGINTAIYSRSGGYQGIGFAIPAAMASAIMDSLLEDGTVDRGWLGVAIQTVNDDLSEALSLDRIGGALVSDVTPDSPADDAGLRPGDVIVGFNAAPIPDAARLRNQVAMAGSGAPFSVTVLRDGREERLTGTLGDRQLALAEAQEATPVSPAGLTVAPLDDAARAELSVPERIGAGVVVRAVEPGSVAAAAGLAAGDIILEVAGQPVRTAGELSRAWESERGRVPLRVWRGGAARYLVVPQTG